MPSSNLAPPQDLQFMQLALQQAAQAAQAGEVPVGAVVVKDGVVIGSGRNSPIGSCDPSAHAEVNALRAAAQAVGNYRLEDCTLYVTLEPCAMCCGCLLQARLKRVVFAAAEPKTGCAGSVLNLFDPSHFTHQTLVEGGLLAAQASQLLQNFFRDRRQQQREQASPLRDDALRTDAARFDSLPDYPWAPHYISDLPILAGLRMHYLDLGPTDSPQTLLCLHPIPGWSYQLRSHIDAWVGQGARVLVPDLIGFGKSDKPKREEFHSLDWHVRCLREWIARLDLHHIQLLVPDAGHALLQRLVADADCRIQDVVVQSLALPEAGAAATPAEQVGLNAPYPDAGHRAAERTFARGHMP